LGLVILLALGSLPPTVHAASPAPLGSFNTASAGPRRVEETTALAIERDYAHAWQALVSALEDNRADLLNEDFTGGARQQWQDAIAAQQQNGLSRHIVDHGHKVRVTFYSLDGSAMEAIDTADLEIQYRENGKLLSSEQIQARYLILLTPAENSWKVRILQEISPS
jgi:DNA-binding FadR family transcriptional regulator